MYSIRKGTAPVIGFTLPFSTELVKKAKLVIKYKNGAKLTKYADASNFDGNDVNMKLTQEETFLFDCNSYIDVLLRVLTISGDPLVSDVYKVFVEECYDDEVLA